MMPLHIGDSIVLDSKGIIGIFSGIERNKEFLDMAGSKFMTRNNSAGASGFIIYRKQEKEYVYFSRISARGLIRRLEKDEEEIHAKKTG